MCFERESLRLRVRPKISGNGLVAWILLFIWILRDWEYSAGSDENKVACILFVLRMRLFCAAQEVIGSRYGCMIISAVL